MCADATACRATANDRAAVAERRLESATADNWKPLGTSLTSSSVTRSPVASAAALTRFCTVDSGAELPTVPATAFEWTAASPASPPS